MRPHQVQHLGQVHADLDEALQGRNAVGGPAATFIDSVDEAFVLRFAIGALRRDLFGKRHRRWVEAHFLDQLLVVAVGAGEIFLFGDRAHGTIRRIVVDASAVADTQIEDALKIVHSLGLAEQFRPGEGFAGDGGVELTVIVDMLGHLVGFRPFGVVRRLDVVPGELAEALEAKPGTEHGKIVQGFGLLLEGGQLVVHHVHEDEPGFVVLGAFVGEVIASLLGKGFLGDVLALLEAFAMEGDILHEPRIGTVLAHHIGGQVPGTPAGEHAKAAAFGYLVHEFADSTPVAPLELDAAGARLV